jgi:hypothetical protein
MAPPPPPPRRRDFGRVFYHPRSVLAAMGGFINSLKPSRNVPSTRLVLRLARFRMHSLFAVTETWRCECGLSKELCLMVVY